MSLLNTDQETNREASIREVFEDWARNCGFRNVDHHMLYVDEYVCEQTNAAWRGWLAAYEHFTGNQPEFTAADVPTRPSMDAVPEWAMFWAVDFDGLANWFSHKPAPFAGRWCYQKQPGYQHKKEAQYKVGRKYWGWDNTLVNVPPLRPKAEVTQ